MIKILILVYLGFATANYPAANYQSIVIPSHKYTEPSKEAQQPATPSTEIKFSGNPAVVVLPGDNDGSPGEQGSLYLANMQPGIQQGYAGSFPHSSSPVEDVTNRYEYSFPSSTPVTSIQPVIVADHHSTAEYSTLRPDFDGGHQGVSIVSPEEQSGNQPLAGHSEKPGFPTVVVSSPISFSTESSSSQSFQLNGINEKNRLSAGDSPSTTAAPQIILIQKEGEIDSPEQNPPSHPIVSSYEFVLPESQKTPGVAPVLPVVVADHHKPLEGQQGGLPFLVSSGLDGKAPFITSYVFPESAKSPGGAPVLPVVFADHNNPGNFPFLSSPGSTEGKAPFVFAGNQPGLEFYPGLHPLFGQSKVPLDYFQPGVQQPFYPFVHPYFYNQFVPYYFLDQNKCLPTDYVASPGHPGELKVTVENKVKEPVLPVLPENPTEYGHEPTSKTPVVSSYVFNVPVPQASSSPSPLPAQPEVTQPEQPEYQSYGHELTSNAPVVSSYVFNIPVAQASSSPSPIPAVIEEIQPEFQSKPQSPVISSYVFNIPIPKPQQKSFPPSVSVPVVEQSSPQTPSYIYNIPAKPEVSQPVVVSSTPSVAVSYNYNIPSPKPPQKQEEFLYVAPQSPQPVVVSSIPAQEESSSQPPILASYIYNIPAPKPTQKPEEFVIFVPESPQPVFVSTKPQEEESSHPPEIASYIYNIPVQKPQKPDNIAFYLPTEVPVVAPQQESSPESPIVASYVYNIPSTPEVASSSQSPILGSYIYNVPQTPEKIEDSPVQPEKDNSPQPPIVASYVYNIPYPKPTPESAAPEKLSHTQPQLLASYINNTPQPSQTPEELENPPQEESSPQPPIVASYSYSVPFGQFVSSTPGPVAVNHVPSQAPPLVVSPTPGPVSSYEYVFPTETPGQGSKAPTVLVLPQSDYGVPNK